VLVSGVKPRAVAGSPARYLQNPPLDPPVNPPFSAILTARWYIRAREAV
jgi:hypothetical protein